jgi:hypothetical protein
MVGLALIAVKEGREYRLGMAKVAGTQGASHLPAECHAASGSRFFWKMNAMAMLKMYRPSIGMAITT